MHFMQKYNLYRAFHLSRLKMLMKILANILIRVIVPLLMTKFYTSLEILQHSLQYSNHHIKIAVQIEAHKKYHFFYKQLMFYKWWKFNVKYHQAWRIAVKIYTSIIGNKLQTNRTQSDIIKIKGKYSETCIIRSCINR